MNLRIAILLSQGVCILIMLAVGLILPLHSAAVVNPGDRLLTPSSIHLFGTDELGRDLFSRFFAGTRYTILTGFTTTLVAGASGYLMGNAARAKPKWFGRIVTGLACACFVVPSFLLAPGWPNRFVTTILCIFPVLPLFFIALSTVALANLTGWATSLPLGLLWGIGIAYAFFKDNSRQALAASTASVFAWAVYLHGALDVLGLGVQPPEPSWGNMLAAQTMSFWPQAAVMLGFLTVGSVAFVFSDAMVRKPKARRVKLDSCDVL